MKRKNFVTLIGLVMNLMAGHLALAESRGGALNSVRSSVEAEAEVRLMQTNWVCYGTPLNNPLNRRICGQGQFESAARATCGFEYVDISCFRN